MKALVYRRSIPLYLLDRLLGRVCPRRFFPRLVPLDLKEVPLAIREKGWVALRNRLCGICGSDLNLLRGAESMLLEPYASFPAVLGHEVVAEVISAPKDSPWQQGERVVVEPILSCEVRGLTPCRFCREGRYNLCENFTRGKLSAGSFAGYNRSVGGGMAEFMAAHPLRLVRVPEDMPDEAAVLTDSLASALHPVLEHFPEDMQSVLVYGGGILGQHIIRILRVLGSRARLVVVARYPFQRDLAMAGGADTVLLRPSRAELGDAAGARWLPTTLGGGNLEGGADFFFDCVGSTHSLQEGLLTLKGRGTYIMVGTAGSLGPVDFSSLWFRELRLTGSVAYSQSTFHGETIRTYQMAMDLLNRHGHAFKGLLTHVYPLEEFARAFRTALDKRAFESVKVAVDMKQTGD